MVFPGADRARRAWWVSLVPYGAPHGDWHVLIDASTGELLRAENVAFDFDGTGKSYLPDPLSSAGQTYGAAGYVDGSDATTPQLLAEIFSVSLPDLTFNGSVYSLTGPYADCRELESPAVACPTDADGDFSDQALDRTDDDFEPQLVYHHIDAFMRYINVTLGIPVTPYQYVGGVRFDAHGLSNADNSHYVGSTGILAFGDGGVDDSEDTDVVIHELGHGLHDWLTSGGLSQTQGLSEGLGDYFGISYSRTFVGQWAPADPQYNWMFSWDGHNPFWSGRLTNWNDNHLYPTNLVGQIHTDGQFWASCNIDIGEAIGYDLADAADRRHLDDQWLDQPGGRSAGGDRRRGGARLLRADDSGDGRRLQLEQRCRRLQLRRNGQCRNLHRRLRGGQQLFVVDHGSLRRAS